MKPIQGGYRYDGGPKQGWKWMSSRAVKWIKGKIRLDQRSVVKDDGRIMVDLQLSGSCNGLIVIPVPEVEPLRRKHQSSCALCCSFSGKDVLFIKVAILRQSRRPASGATYTLVDILRAILLSLEAMIEDPELQVNGFVLIIDWSNFTFKQASKLTPSMLRLAIEGLQDSFPARFGGIHFVNQPWYIHALYTVIRPFLKEKTRKRIFLHGNNLNSLHQLIHPEILPSEFGGMLPPYDMGTWARTLLDHEYDDDSEYNVDSYSMPVKEVEKELSPKSMKRSQSVVDPTVLKRMDKNEEENMQPLLSLD
ncbi:clavesin-2 [Leptonychotes weddellii]|uniref:Clavesin-2 n=1 Tax=Leptonychotes weddellii TaxID=9713 RepID=A0A2U3Y0Q2_LEPWE|nr:clavesin-2 [Leptonychotes weddellii]